LRKFSANAYEIELPEDMRMSPIFNVSYLYSYVEPEEKQSTKDLDKET